MPGNSNLHDSSRNKQDEFYTNLQLIEDELKHYRAHFKGKRVLCNCDDPYESNFFKYFAMNFNSLGLKSLTATCYAASPFAQMELDLFGNGECVSRKERKGAQRRKSAYKIVISEVKDENGDGRVDLADVEWLIKNKKNVLTKLKGDGDFRSAECEKLLDDADLVVTNPPFSLFREYVAQLMEHKKQFLVIGNMNAVTYREIFPLIKDNKVWLGNKAGHFWFRVPPHYEEKATDFKIDENGQKWRRMGNICWFTNLDFKKRHEKMLLWNVRHGFPLNVMYWVRNGDGGYEMLDGQQRTISICRYLNGEFSINHQSIGNLTAEERETILGYELVIYICEGTEREKLDWFDVVNTAGEKLTTQERRNAIYAGPWLNEAKKYFSKTGCPAVQRAEKYMNGSAIRQQILETVLGWIADRDGGDIEDYMSAHQHDKGCEDLWSYFEAVVRWTEVTFTNPRVKLMKGLPWGVYYNRYGKTKYDANAIESKIAKLLRDDDDIGDITNQRGIYEYALDGDERHLSIRKFSDKMARTAYERQKGVCPKCGRKFAIEEMEADHIKPWSKGGRTVAENCQMLCADCNRRKGGK